MLETREEIFEALRNHEITIRAAMLMLMQIKLTQEIKKEVANENSL